MAALKQFDFQVTGRGTLTDGTLPATAANLAFTADIITINGISTKVSTLDSTSVTAIQSAMETIVIALQRLSQTITITTASVANDETVTITLGGFTVTYTNSSGSAVAHTAGALATALKGACDADTAFAARFDAAVSGNNLVLTQKAPQTKLALAVVGGTGITGADTVTVA